MVMEFIEVLRQKFGAQPFKAADVLEQVAVDDLPLTVQYVARRGTGSGLRSIGRALGALDGVEQVGMHHKSALWMVKP